MLLTKSVPMTCLLCLFCSFQPASAATTTAAHSDSSQIAGPEVRLSLVLGGAISLGAFEAGVVVELLKQLIQHNKNRAMHQPKYVIDIMAGASAGSILLAMLATELMQPLDKLDDWEEKDWKKYIDGNNRFYEGWVKAIGYKELLPLEREDNNRGIFFFDSKAIKAISDTMLFNGNSHVDQPSIAPDSLFLAMTLTSLRGINGIIKFQSKLDSPQQRHIKLHDDSRRFLITREKRVNEFSNNVVEPRLKIQFLSPNLETIVPAFKADIKQEFRKTVLASRAIPLVFKPDLLRRSNKEYHQVFANEMDCYRDDHYVDGGALNNDPFYLAQEIITKRERRRPSFNAKPRTIRKILFIEPDPDLGAKEEKPAQQVLSNLFEFSKSIAKIYKNTAESLDNRNYLNALRKNQTAICNLADSVIAIQDSLTAAKFILAVKTLDSINAVNSDLEMLKLASELTKELKQVNPPRLYNMAIEYSRKIFDNVLPCSLLTEYLPKHMKCRDVEQSTDNRLRTKINEIRIQQILRFIFDGPDVPPDFERVHKQLRDGSNLYQKSLFILIFLARSYIPSSSLILISERSIHGPNTQLAGKGLGHFGAFFHRKLRDYDYRIGRFHCQRILRDELGLNIRQPISADSLNAWKKILASEQSWVAGEFAQPKFSLPLKDLKAHLPRKEDRKDLRKRIDKRFRGYYKLQRLGFLTRTLVNGIVDTYFDRILYKTRPRGVFSMRVKDAGARLGFRGRPLYCLDNPFTNRWFFGVEEGYGSRPKLGREFFRFSSSFLIDLQDIDYLNRWYLDNIKLDPEIGYGLNASRYGERKFYYALNFRVSFIDVRLEYDPVYTWTWRNFFQKGGLSVGISI